MSHKRKDRESRGKRRLIAILVSCRVVFGRHTLTNDGVWHVAKGCVAVDFDALVQCPMTVCCAVSHSCSSCEARKGLLASEECEYAHPDISVLGTDFAARGANSAPSLISRTSPSASFIAQTVARSVLAMNHRRNSDELSAPMAQCSVQFTLFCIRGCRVTTTHERHSSGF